MAPVVYAAIPEYKEEPEQLKIDFHFVRRVRVSMVAMLMAGFMEGALIALIPIYALREGFTEPQTGLLLSAFMIGHGSFPPLIGILGDRIGLRRVLLITYGLGAVSFSAMHVYARQHGHCRGTCLRRRRGRGALSPCRGPACRGAVI